MKKLTKICFAVVSMFLTNAAFADELCLIGTWTAAEETATPLEQADSAQNGGLVQTASEQADSAQYYGLVQTVAIVSGSVSIEFAQDGTVRITYDDYTAALNSAVNGRNRTVRSVYSGTAEGNFMAQDNKLALGRFPEVSFEALIRLPDGTFVSAESGTKQPPHEKSGYVFECEGSDLLLTADVHRFFLNAKYRGRFTRSN